MRLVSLSLQGFKSFADKTTIEFEEGITGVVGPNGSGKSNVIDALKWASGGGRASEFRAGDKTELIFHGSASKRSLGYAEVALSLQNEQGSLHITRSLFKNGQSKLKLGGKNARFIDVEEALAGSGLGKGGLAIIGQGEVSGVLMADPTRLLGYVEEAAGVSRLSTRREQTIARLETTKEHLTRLEDIVGELEKQLTQLSQEAEQATKSAALTREKLRLRFTLAYRRAESLRIEVKSLQDDRGKLENERNMGEKRLSEAKEHWQKAREAVTKIESDYRQALADLETKRGDVRVAEERLARLLQHQQGLFREAELLQKDVDNLENTPEPIPPEGDVGELEQSLAKTQAQLAEKQQTLNELISKQASIEERLRQLRDIERAQAQAEAAFESQVKQLKEQLSEIEKRLESLPSSESDEQEIVDEFESKKKHIFEQQVALEAMQKQLVDKQQAHANCAAEALGLKQSLKRIEAAFQARQGYAQGPKNALQSGIRGVIGSVADLLNVPDEYQQALSAALGRRAENVVVDSSNTAQEVIRYVKSQGGLVTLLPLDLIAGRSTNISHDLASEPSVLGVCLELIDFATQYRNIFTQLLGNTTVIENLDDATNLAKRYKQRPRFVTLAGDILENYGAITGGRRGGGSVVLNLKNDFDATEAIYLVAEEKRATAYKKFEDLQNQVNATKQALLNEQLGLKELEQKYNQAREATIANKSLVEELNRRQAELKEQLDNLKPPDLDLDIRELPQFESQQQAFGEQVEALRQAEAKANTQASEIKQQLVLFKEREKNYQEALEAFREGRLQLEGLKVRLKDIDKDLVKAEKDVEEAKEEQRAAKAAIPKNIGKVEASYNEATTQSQQAEQKLSELTNQQTEVVTKFDEVKLALARRESAMEAAEGDLKEFPEELEPLEGSLKKLRTRLGEVEAELEAIGPVNHRAQQDLEAQTQRFNDLQNQNHEISQAARELEDMLAEIQQEVTTRLNNALTRLRKNFQTHVKELFGANSDSDIKVEREEERPVGLKISLQPSNKQTRSLNLLSVGERTMGAMAFLFALMSGESNEEHDKGLPIAILDEVDAPLDEANIRRFCSFLIQRAKAGTQFVLITHQKTTMEVADVLWGVTTEGGASRVFSIRKD